MLSQPAIITFASLFVLLAALISGIPVAFSIGLTAIIFLVIVTGLPQTITVIGLYSNSVPSNYILVSLPLFVFMAEIIAGAGIAADLFDCTRKWLSRLPGGLAVAAVWASALFGAVCGSGAATAAVIGIVTIPVMLDHGYSKTLAFGSVTGSAFLGQVIPPSLPLIIFGVLADESIGKLFIAGIIPGVLMTLALSGYIIIAASRKRDLAPKVEERVSWHERWVSLHKTWPAIVLFGVVLGSIYAGIATITESAAAGAVGALVIAAGLGKLKWQLIKGAILNTVRLNCFCLAILIAGNLFGHLLTLVGVSTYIYDVAQSLPSPLILMLVINILWLVMGCFLDMSSIMVLTIPVLMPAFKSMGWDTVWLGIVMLFNMGIGTITPPVGIHFFVSKGVGDSIANKYGKTSLESIIQSSYPYILITLIVMVLVIVFPPLSTWLPAQMMKPIVFR